MATDPTRPDHNRRPSATASTLLPYLARSCRVACRKSSVPQWTGFSDRTPSQLSELVTALEAVAGGAGGSACGGWHLGRSQDHLGGRRHRWASSLGGPCPMPRRG